MNKLRQWVQGLVDRGVNLNSLPKTPKGQVFIRWCISKDLRLVRIYQCKEGLDNRYYTSLPDLLLNTEAMKSGYGEDEVCNDCGMKKRLRTAFGYHYDSDGRKVHRKCSCSEGKLYLDDIFLPAYQYHGIHAIKMIYDGKTEEALNYLIGEMKNVKGTP